jgi:ATP-dependent Clp protease, protease subunit
MMVEVYNEQGNLVIDVNAPIGGVDGFNLQKFNDAVKDISEDMTVRMKMKTNGGDVFEAFAIHDAVRDLPNRSEVDIIGASASAGTIIAAAADYRRISKNSRYLVHLTQSGVEGNKNQMRQRADELDSFDAQLTEIYKKQITKSEEDLLALLGQEKWLTAEEALEWGFVDEIIEVKQLKNKQMKKFQNLTEEEKEEMDALKAEIETLKAKLAEKDEEIENFKAEKEQKEDEEIDAEVTALIKSGKFKADAKADMIVLAKNNRAAFKAVVSNMQTAAPVVNLLDVPAQNDAAPDKPQPKTKAEAWALYQNGTIGTDKEYLAVIKTMEG